MTFLTWFLGLYKPVVQVTYCKYRITLTFTFPFCFACRTNSVNPSSALRSLQTESVSCGPGGKSLGISPFLFCLSLGQDLVPGGQHGRCLEEHGGEQSPGSCPQPGPESDKALLWG